jgi:GPI mannosyltransferase 3
MSVANPWQWYCSTRTFSNCFEATLTIAALHYFPWGLLGLEKAGKDEAKTAEVFQQTGSVNG